MDGKLKLNILQQNSGNVSPFRDTVNKLWKKIKSRSRATIINKFANTPYKFKIYISYWHYKWAPEDLLSKYNSDRLNSEQYLTQQPNYGAGIGHQLANWNSGLYFARYFNLKYAHSPFSNRNWEDFLGFGEGEETAENLIKEREFKVVNLPKFNPTIPTEINLIKNIISSYIGLKVLFRLELDQGYKRQCDTSEILSDKFFSAQARKKSKIIYDADVFNIAIHIRRGDIVQLKNEQSSTWKTRWLDNNYYADILRQVLSLMGNRRFRVYLFSQGEQSDFVEFSEFKNLIFCLDMNAIDSFLHLASADLLISSKSSFSYKPALISKGIVICPIFWHSYPDTPNYIQADDEGKFDQKILVNQLKKINTGIQ